MTVSDDLRAADLTLEEKAALTSGADFWTTKALERVGIPPLLLTDGPHGLRKQTGGNDHLGLGASVPATCFPPAVGLSASFDPELAERVGVALGVESAIEDVAVILGPGINIKRSPLCGRNFEYMSEDPIVSGAMGAGLVKGIQSQGVGSSLKHFAANNQETDRLRISADVDPRPLREIYLRGFQRVIEDAQPWTVMCSYNRINGVYASEDPWLLTRVLRDEWGFSGLVVSDWGAVNHRVAGILAGMDLEMPSSNGRTDAELVDAVREERLDELCLDVVADRLIELARKAQARPAIAGPLDVDAHHALAREVAGRSIVLLKNDGVLPLTRGADLAVIGEFARTPRFQGAGSSQITPTRVDTALDAIRAAAGSADVPFAAGFDITEAGVTEAETERLRAEAVGVAQTADTVLLFLGIPAHEESEGYDRTHIDLPAAQLALLDAVLEVNPNVVVVLSNGGVVSIPFARRVPAIVEAWLLGQAGGSATADVLFGDVNPSGRLAETIPQRLEDTPAHGSFPGEHGHVRYGEGLLVGYRWYDEKQLAVRYPFGHGLSYTTFSYGDAAAAVREDGDIVVMVPVTNTGAVAGREVVQAYTSLPGSAVQRPPRELKAFASVHLEPGETASVALRIRRSELAYWDVRIDRWIVEGGDYVIEVGASSRDLRTSTAVAVGGDEVVLPVSLASSFDELLHDPVVGPDLHALIDERYGTADEHLLKMMGNFPVGRLDGFPLPRREMVAVVEKARSGAGSPSRTGARAQQARA
ncbi:glycoside hydrolase family 3 C-terminal domain-containing protein [Microbacterium sp. ASV81]|uniref:Glycoside hydrolase family 3 C-terminal domain-containing protein n=1 Tax=Microbacterium capsulatum TaxID=3041921 RepID=A0ABU0XJ13_9MICO|nr:glycoside hydrolase family 3 C-terminal domain-containing protein [Microbacterium sp. ASV81]MDQ4215125.1 glycoside hydrolase family 3 C-terminal domain-containing protein [Microbacterium sp. ASV81]